MSLNNKKFREKNKRDLLAEKDENGEIIPYQKKTMNKEEKTRTYLFIVKVFFLFPVIWFYFMIQYFRLLRNNPQIETRLTNKNIDSILIIAIVVLIQIILRAFRLWGRSRLTTEEKRKKKGIEIFWVVFWIGLLVLNSVLSSLR